MPRDDEDARERARHEDGGLEAVLAALRQEDFPMEKTDIYYAVGDLALTDAGRIVSVREVLDRVDRSRFQSPDDIAHALLATMRAEAAARLPE